MSQKSTAELRIACLSPSATAMVQALGLEKHLVGVSHECAALFSLKNKRILTLPRISRPRPREKKASCAFTAKQRLALYEVNLDALKEADPDVVLTGFCSDSLPELEQALETLLKKNIQVKRLMPQTLEEVFRSFEELAVLFSMSLTGKALLNGFQSRIKTLRTRLQTGRKEKSTPPKVLSLDWLDPPMVDGLWMPDLIELAGGHALASSSGQASSLLDLDSSLAPDFVFIKPCGHNLFEAQEEWRQKPELENEFKALWPHSQFFLLDAHSFFSIPSPKLISGAELLASCLYPESTQDLQERYQAYCLPL